MPLDLSAASLIRSGSGLLFVGIGVGLAVLARRGAGDAKLARALALHCVGFGGSFIAFNLGASDPILSPYFVVVNGACWAAATVGIGGAVLALQPSRRRLAIYGFAAALLTILIAAWTRRTGLLFVQMQGLPPSGAVLYTVTLFFVALGSTAPVFVVAELAFAWGARPADEARGLPLLALALATFPFYNTPSVILLAPADLFLAGVYVLMLTGLLVWLVIGEITARRAWTVPFVALLASVAGLLVAGTPSLPEFGIVGIVRIGAGLALATAILRHDAFRMGIRAKTVNRGSLAAGALASLFVVAQVAQNFLSAQYGLLMGGVVAGTFLFAAQPLQRAMERLTDARAPAPPVATAARAAPESAAEAYRHALRAAMRDGHLSRREERHLAELARVLHIDAAHALDLREEIEKEVAPHGA